METKDIVLKAEDYVYTLLDENLPDNYVFHNAAHTRSVTDAARKIAKKSGLSKENIEIITLAALFHDTGYTLSYEGHEDNSIALARKFLSENSYPQDKIDQVSKVIEGTIHPQKPVDLMQEIICDADYFHLAQEDYPVKADLLRLEWEKALGKEYTDYEWYNNNVEFFISHNYYTGYAKKTLQPGKDNNLVALQKRARKNEPKKKDKAKADDSKKVKSRADRGIETMFRNAIRTHVEFSGLADNKANIMISINTLIIGAVVTLLLRKLDNNPHLILPTIMLITTSMTCIIFAILAAKPKRSEGKFTRASIENKETNLLFFGNFFNMDLKEFSWGMHELMRDPNYLYGSMIKDFYYLGQAVGRKYKYVNICFNIFMYGLILSIIAYIIAVLTVPMTDFNLFE